MPWKLIYRYTVLIVCLFLSALIFNTFLYPTNLVTGGMNGIAVLLSHLFEITPSTILFIGNLLMLILSAIFLGKEETFACIIATILYPLFVSLTSSISNIFVVDTTDFLLMSILTGILLGLTNGFMYKVGFSNGGLNIISQIFYKYYKIALSKTTMIVNIIVVLLGGFYFSFPMVLYAFIVIYLSSFIIEKVLLGLSNKKAFYIITSKDEEIKDYIIKNLKHSVTLFPVKTGLLEKKEDVLLAVVPTKEYYKASEGIKLIDKDAFFVVCDAYEVMGGK